MDKPMEKFWTPIIAAIVGSVLTGVAIWYVAQPRNTVVGYNTTTTTVGAGPEIKSLIPDLRIQINNRDVPIFYVSDISFIAQGGPGADSLRVALLFPEGTRIFGTYEQAPTPLHNISCVPLDKPYNFVCKFGRLNPKSPNNKFRFEVATDQKGPIGITTDANTVTLVSLDDLLRDQETIVTLLGIRIPFTAFFTIVFFFTVISAPAIIRMTARLFIRLGLV
jgi:hypothetical protein